MTKYWENESKSAKELYDKMVELRDKAIDEESEKLFRAVAVELSYRVAAEPIFVNKCPKCECPIPDADYDYYCGFCGQFIRK